MDDTEAIPLVALANWPCGGDGNDRPRRGKAEGLVTGRATTWGHECATVGHNGSYEFGRIGQETTVPAVAESGRPWWPVV
ncbi:hypothetical protein JCM18897A_19280 [Streptomyces sp. JCM 18897]|uniref:Uncharacterized protein n=1 Tax=Streptomyces albidoflavus TaxID=1886 RepID=A0AA37C0L1_9ACTN|nr:hypothetical protein ScoT_43660 [Streptomyces albidoflavus]